MTMDSEATLGVAGIKTGIVVGVPNIAVSFSFFSHGQTPEDARPSTWFALTATQARDLIRELARRLDQIEMQLPNGHPKQ